MSSPAGALVAVHVPCPDDSVAMHSVVVPTLNVTVPVGVAPAPLIGSQGRGACNAGPVPHPPFNPCVRFSRTRLTDGLRDMVTPPSGNE